jgi:hypothetical protein
MDGKVNEWVKKRFVMYFPIQNGNLGAGIFEYH